MMRVLVLLPTTSYRARDLLQAASRLQLDIVVGTDRRQALQDDAPEGTLTFDLRHPEAAVEEIAERHRAQPLAAVLGVDDETVHIAALAAAHLGLPANPIDAVGIAGDKWRFRQLQAAAGLPHPWHRLFRRQDDPRAAAAAVFFPCVVKPTFLSASRGVIRANDVEEFVTAWHRIGRLLALPEVRERDPARADALLVEGFIDGQEFALEGLLNDGSLQLLTLFDKPEPLAGPFFEETILVTPSRQPAPVQRQIGLQVERTLQACGLRHGPVHAEVRLTPTGDVVVLEIAPRSIGGLCGRVLRFGTGHSLEEVVLLHATGAAVESLQRQDGAAGVMMIPIPGAGILRGVRGVARAKRTEGVQEIEIAIRRGQPVVPLPEGNRYLGFIFARGDTTAAVEASLRRAHAVLRFDIAPAG